MTKYFIIGLNKTGTSSIRHALRVALGRASLVDSRRTSFVGIDDIFSFTDSLIKIKKSVFKDRPWNTGCYKELNERYNNSKFILTIRDQEEWWTSVKNWLSITAKWTEKFNQDEKIKIKNLNNKIGAYNKHFNCDSLDKDCYINYYNSYNNAVIEYFKDKSNLYVLNLDKDFNWSNIQKITNLDEETMIYNIINCLEKKDFLPDDFNGKIENLKLKDFKFLKKNENYRV
jgi:hypothetical protein